jgi:uncharacterized protein (DUF1697 family)
MKYFIALLRGINVSGQKQIKMAELKTLFENIGFKNVETYIQSGNVIFASKEKSIKKLEDKISSGIKNKFGFDVQVIVIISSEIEYILKTNPFLKKKDADKLYVTFLSIIPSVENVEKLNSVNYLPEEYVIDGRYIYLFFTNGYGRAKLNNNYFENKLKVFCTTRNWKTVVALSDLLKLH